MAVDLLPIPFVQKDWKDIPRFERLGRFVVDVGKEIGVAVRWGGDWDRDGDTKDEKFRDLPHFELVG